MKRGWVVLTILWTLLPASATAQRGVAPSGNTEPTGTIEVLAYSTLGVFLGSPEIHFFGESFDKKNLASRFQKGIATEIPYAVYIIEAGLPGFASETKTVRVFQKHVTLIVGVELRIEAPGLPPSTHGRVIGTLPQSKTIFVKATGVFSSWSVESKIAPDGGFDLSWLPEGTYVLMVLNEDGILASRVVKLPYGPGLQIELGKDRAIPTPD